MQSIGRYHVKRELGRGAMGVVYLAEDPAIGRLVAIKTINLDNLSQPGEEALLRERLMREARSAGILSHPGIVTVYDIIQQTEHKASIVMEFVEGITILDKMNENALEPEHVLSMLEQTAEALDYAHSKGVFHRDIKPANLMVTTAGIVKIADFGIARLTSQMTVATSTVLGTPSYMSPEQIAGKTIGPATDQFSLAVIAFELLTGQKPFSADTISALLFSIVFKDPISIRELNPSVSPEVESVLKKALSKELADRYPSCKEFTRALKNACETRKTWRPVKTVRGPILAVPSIIANLPAPKWEIAETAALQALEPIPAPKPFPEPLPTAAIAPPLPAVPVSKAEPPPAPQRRSSKIAVALVVGFAALASGVVIFLTRADNRQKPAQPVASASGPAGPKPEPIRKATPAITNPVSTPASQPKSATHDPSAIPDPLAGAIPFEITTVPSRAKVSAKGQECISPCTLNLPQGEYYVTASLEGFKDTAARVVIPRQLEVSIRLDRPMGTIEIYNHAGSTIYIDGKPHDKKAPARVFLPAGEYSIYLETPDGGKTPAQKIELTDGKIVEVR